MYNLEWEEQVNNLGRWYEFFSLPKEFCISHLRQQISNIVVCEIVLQVVEKKCSVFKSIFFLKARFFLGVIYIVLYVGISFWANGLGLSLFLNNLWYYS